MKFKSLQQCVQFLKNEDELILVDVPVDPELEMAHITRRVFENQGPALLFTKVKGSGFPALSNLMGTWSRTCKIFEPQLERVKKLVDIRSHPGKIFKKPHHYFNCIPALLNAIPRKVLRNAPVMSGRCKISDLPQIKCWPEDGGAFVLLPQVFSMDPANQTLFNSNLGMYRIQMSGNEYAADEQIGLHYQIHRGIGNHHQAALKRKAVLPVSIFIGGPPAHTLAAVMPLPEGLPEISFAGALAGRSFRYLRNREYLMSADADFCITGVVVPGRTKPEGPFGDHMGYYSLTHDYPYLKVTGVYHRKDAIFPFTVVGRPPQEDTNFGRLIHEITCSAVKGEIPGVKAVNAVDDAGVHPLLLATASERYVPFEKRQPRELITHAVRILGTGQLSLAKYLLIAADENDPGLDVNREKEFFVHVLERIDFSRDLHFLTQTPMDTLDYSSGQINSGSKLVMAAAGEKKRTLETKLPEYFSLPEPFCEPRIAAPGMVVLKGPEFENYKGAKTQLDLLKGHLGSLPSLDMLPLFVIVDDPGFASRSFSNFLWVTFLKSNPSHDIYGSNERFVFKHWQCDPPLIIDARTKPFHAGTLNVDETVEEKVKKLGQKGGVLAGII